MTTYWASVEFDITEPSKHGNCVGGFVCLFLQANDVLDAIPIINAAIGKSEFTVREIEFVSIYEDIPWESEEEQTKHDNFASESAKSGTVVWGDIYCYENKDN